MSQYVVGFGDNVVDYYINHNVKYPGGNAVNFAVNARKSGVKSYYVGSISSDTDGEFLRQTKLTSSSNQAIENLWMVCVVKERHPR
jgi:fructoselysine 6-kinase